MVALLPMPPQEFRIGWNSVFGQYERRTGIGAKSA